MTDIQKMDFNYEGFKNRKKEKAMHKERMKEISLKILNILESEGVSIKETRLILDQCNDRIQALTKVNISEF